MNEENGKIVREPIDWKVFPEYNLVSGVRNTLKSWQLAKAQNTDRRNCIVASLIF